MIASSPEVLLDLVDRHRNSSAFARAATLAWTQMQVQLRHLGITHAEAARLQALGGMVMRHDPRLRATPAQIAAGAAQQSTLWPWGISGDLPIVVLQIDDVEDIAALHQALSVHEYWGMRQISVDLVILNDRSSSYVQDLQNTIESAVRAARSRPGSVNIHSPTRGSIYTLRTDLMNREAKDHLIAAARVSYYLRGAATSAASCVASALRPSRPWPAGWLRGLPAVSTAAAAPAPSDLEFFNGIGGFARTRAANMSPFLARVRARPLRGSTSLPTPILAFRFRPKAAALSGPKTVAKTS